ncbi:MAG: hypothetical protein OEV43_08025 [Coriobacteriia bacterium]|nr:hypothetical protein [Coriobacteriia bacterium]
MSQDLLSIGSLVLGVWVVGASLVMTFFPGMGLRKGEEWASPENVFLLFSDYLLGGWLLFSVWAPVAPLGGCLLLGALALTHLFRCTQVILGLPRPFCMSKLTILLNVIRLTLAAALWGACVVGI